MVFTNRSAPHRPQLRRCEVTHTHTHALDEGRGEVGESLSTRQACSLTERNAPRSSRFSRSLSLDLHHCALAPRGSIHSRSLSPLSLSLPRSLSLSSLSLSRGRHSIPLPLLPDHSHSLAPLQGISRVIALPIQSLPRPHRTPSLPAFPPCRRQSGCYLGCCLLLLGRPSTPVAIKRHEARDTAPPRASAPPDDSSDRASRRRLRPDETRRDPELAQTCTGARPMTERSSSHLSFASASMPPAVPSMLAW